MKFTFTFLMSLILGANLYAQNSLTGTVKSSKGKALSQSTILINNQAEAISNSNGYFEISNLKSGLYTISIYYLGYQVQSKTFDIDGSLELNFQLTPIVFSSQEVVVSATRTFQVSNTIPASVSTITSEELLILPSQTIDEKLMYTSGMNIDRPFGIFGKSVVGMRGVVSSEPGRQLTLIDGVAINKSDGGGVNWNRIIQSDIARVEVVKGPSGSIYGNNAMGGTINLITKKPNFGNISGSSKMFYGTYNTMGIEANAMKYFGESKKGMYFSTSAKASKSDGYNTVPEEMRESSDTAVFMNDKGVNIRVGKDFSLQSNLEFEYNYFADTRGQGTKIKLENGSLVNYNTHFFKTKYTDKIGVFNLSVNAFYQKEKYQKDIEKLKKGNYTYIKVESDRADYGVLLSATANLKNHTITFGSDIRLGEVDAFDKYMTATDVIINKGKIDNYTLYFQDQMFLFDNKLSAIVGGNILYSKFHSGSFDVKNPTRETSIQQKNIGDLPNKEWIGFSPKLSIQYNFNEKISLFTSLSQGFRTANLDDYTRSGFINIGYKEANTELTPETINSVEIGLKYENSKLLVNVTPYYSVGKDFMHYVATGETIFGGRKRVYKKQNISEVEIYGNEFSAEYKLLSYLNIFGNYTYSNSKILAVDIKPELLGKQLSYSPNHISNVGVKFLSSKFSASAIARYKSSFYTDEQNLEEIEGVFTADINARYQFYKGFSLGLNLQNILDKRFMVSNDQESLGRFTTVELSYQF